MDSVNRTVITGVRVFDGHRLLPPATVMISGGSIGGPVDDAAGADVVDGDGGVLLPGLIDAHVHLHGRKSLEQLRGWGVTTALDMACGPVKFLDSLRGIEGLTDIRSAGIPAVAPGSMHSRIPVVGELGLVSGAAAASEFVAARVSEGSDYIKIVLGSPGGDHDQATLNALVAAAHRHGKLAVAHTAAYEPAVRALAAGVDVLTHVPLDRALDEGFAARALAGGQFMIPTLAMMEGVVVQQGRPGASYAAAHESVSVLHAAGVPVLAGTDANSAPGVPARISHGESLHRELELLVDAGLSTVDALRAATVLPARYFGLADRGEILPGYRADLVLIDGDPVQDIKETRSIRRIWCGGADSVPS
jgi:imidazolonepropionase-like amidohydrolase